MYIPLESRKIQMGDVLEKSKEYPNDSFDCIISSPPYWALRDYRQDGQWGLESDYNDFLKLMQEFMTEMKRILKPTGSCWINIGDTYSSGGSGKKSEYGGRPNEANVNSKQAKSNVKAKSRYGIPDRFYIQCIDNGWIARNVIPWVKWNAMPTSVQDRLTYKWEYLYFFVKEQKYYFNLHEIRVAAMGDMKSVKRHIKETAGPKPIQTTFGGLDDIEINDDAIHEKYDDKNSNVSRLHKNRKVNPNNKQDNVLGPDGKPLLTYKGFNDRWKNRKMGNVPGQTMQSINKNNSGGYDKNTGISLSHPAGKNPGDIMFDEFSDEELLQWIKLCRDDVSAWELAPPDLFFINPKPLPEAHFAAFPVALPTRILKCACPKETCIKCGRPRFPITKTSDEYQKILDSNIPNKREDGMTVGLQSYKKGFVALNNGYVLAGYDKCDCNDEFIPGIVLDPFGGAGSTAIAAEELGLRWQMIELKDEYTSIARKRLSPYMNQEIFA